MLRRTGRLLPLLAAALILGVFGFGSLAIAGDDDDHGGSQPQRCDDRCHHDQFSAWDEEWLKTSIEGDRFEIEGGKLAQEKGTTEKVRELGATLVKDHTKSLEDAVEVAEDLGIEVPSEPSPSQQWELRAVSQFNGAEFDRWYADLEVQDHKQDIQEAEDEVDKGCNRDVRKLAKEDIPVLEEHLRLAQAALDALS